MFGLLWLVPAVPLAGFVILAVAGARLPRKLVATIGAGSVGISAVIAILIGISFLGSPPPNNAYAQTLWTWIRVGDFVPSITFRLDALSLVMILVVSFVGFLIHFYSAEFMKQEEGYSRFFAYMNLFVASMLTLVLADNLLFLYLGWEGVGLCSYLLIGFWYKTPANGRAAMKAFIVTRVGDTSMLIGIFLIFTHLGTLDIQPLMERATNQWAVGSLLPVAAALLLLGGAVGKSAQLPLQVWLPDAMAGPTPVSALIHAATMVTAGVYLIARLNAIFTLAPAVQSLVAIVGAVTLLLAGFSGMTQWDIKRVLAYSTISQIGYMFLALGVGAWSAAIFHFMTHAFFKSLLFLGAGVVIQALHEEHNMFKMGGLRKELPVVFWVFLIGSLALSGLPPTAGFASKDLILYRVWTSPNGGPWLWAAGLVGVFLTSVYTYRMLFLTFLGPLKEKPARATGFTMGLTLVVLAAFCFIAASLNWSSVLGGTSWFTDFLHSALPAAPVEGGSPATEFFLEIISVVICLLGIGVTWRLFVTAPGYLSRVAQSFPANLAHRFWFAGWGFDWIYDKIFIRPFVWFAWQNKDDYIDRSYDGVARVAELFHYILSFTQTGNLRWYAAGITVGGIIIIAFMVFL